MLVDRNKNWGTVATVSSPEHFLALDVGGTKLAAALVSGAGSIVSSESRPTAGVGTADELFERCVQMLEPLASCLPRSSISAIGVGCGGPMRAHGTHVSPLNIPVWRDFPLRTRLAERFDLPCHLTNDAKALALGEWWRGAGRGHANFLSMVVSTGIGGGVILDGRLLEGGSGNAGHIGHIVVEPDGRTCRCGAVGCVEAEASGTAIAAITGAPPKDATLAVRQRAGMLVGRAVSSVVTLLDLPLALVAGSVALGFGKPFFAAAQNELSARAKLSYARSAEIRPAGLRDHGPLIGAAAVAVVAERGPEGLQ